MNVHWLWPSAAVASFALTWAAMRLAERRRLLDVPNERSSHARPVPRGGGVAIVLTFMAGVVVAGFYGILDTRLLVVVLGGGGLLGLVGFVDDFRDVPAGWRLVLHILVAGWALYWLDGIPNELLPGVPPVFVNFLGLLCGQEFAIGRFSNSMNRVGICPPPFQRSSMISAPRSTCPKN